jgi:hypothetical protein
MLNANPRKLPAETKPWKAKPIQRLAALAKKVSSWAFPKQLFYRCRAILAPLSEWPVQMRPGLMHGLSGSRSSSVE